MSLFFFEVYEHVHKDKAKEYESLGAEADKLIKETEPGMLIHVQTKVSENDHEVVYRWLEVYEEYEDLQFHVANESVQALAKKLGRFLCAPLEVIVHCDWTEEQKEPWRRPMPGASLTFAPLVNGYFR